MSRQSCTQYIAEVARTIQYGGSRKAMSAQVVKIQEVREWIKKKL